MSSAKEAVKGRSPHWQAIGLLTICGLLVPYVLRFLGASQTWSEYFDRAVVSLGFFILLGGLVFREISRIRKEKYANIQEDLHGISHTARDQLSLLNSMEGMGKEQIKLQEHIVNQNLQHCLNKFSSIFTLLTGTKCRASIKMIDYSRDRTKPVVYTYMRDGDSHQSFVIDDERRKSNGMDLLGENSDFQIVFGEQGERWFFSNDLTTHGGYINSRAPNLRVRNLTGLRAIINIVRPVDWPLPYTSGIVWPIRQMPLRPNVGTSYKLAGYLTIDSAHRGVFRKNFDTHLGAGVADCLYHMLVRQDEVGTTDGGDVGVTQR
jgi:hypothetical protein